MATSKTHSVSVLYLLPLRLAAGLSFLITGQAKLASGELLVGFSIFLGLFTRFGASVGIFIALNYLFRTGIGFWMPNLEVMYLWAMVTLLICSAGRAIGADALLQSNRKIRLFT